jgi:hypothetical protein
MNKKTFFVFEFLLIFFILVLHLTAVRFYFYWTYWWFDIMMHFLSGFWFTSLFLWFSNLRNKGSKRTYGSFLIVAILASLSIGILWEIFEYTTKLTFTSGNYVSDTISDVIMDMVGGVIASVYIYVGSWKRINT